MKYILAIDDTDNHDSPGTGEHLESIINILVQDFGCRCTRVTRHQLFFSPQIKYTSHNSAMATIVTTNASPYQVFNTACEYLLKHAAQGSDPGVCLLDFDDIMKTNRSELMKYGQKAKTEYIYKIEAYKLAEDYGIMLREIGGEGIGIIGALAGAALRLGGSDGRYKGNFELALNHDNMLCKDILTHPLIDQVMMQDGTTVSLDAEIFITEKIKTVHLFNKSVLLVKRQKTNDGEVFVNIPKSELKKY